MEKKSKSGNSIKFGSLKLEQCIFEVRCYNRQVFLAVMPDFWDAVEKRLNKPIIYRIQDTASTTVVEKSIQLSIEQERFSVAAFSPQKSLEKFIEITSDFYGIVREILRMEKIIRIGFRLIYVLDFEDSESAIEAFMSLPFIGVPDNLSLSKSGKPMMPTYYLGWQDGKKAIVYRMKGNFSTLTVDLPLQLSLSGEYPERIEKAFNQFVFDVDVHITEPVSPEEFLPKEWLGQAYEIVNADGITFFGD